MTSHERPLSRAKASKKMSENVVSTGYAELDYYIGGGFHRSDVVVLAASPGVGNASLALNIADRAANTLHTPVILFDLLSPKKAVLERMLTIHTGTAIKSGQNVDLNVMLLYDRMEGSVLKSIEVFGTDSECRLLSEIRDQCMMFSGKDPYASTKRRKKSEDSDSGTKENDSIPGLIIINNMQNIAFDGERAITKHEFSELAKRIKKIAVETGCPILLLSNLLRDVTNRRDKHPRLSDLRHFGLPKEVADKVILLYRDEFFCCDSVEKNIAELTIFNRDNFEKPELMRLRTNIDNYRFEEMEDAMVLWPSDDDEKMTILDNS